MCYAYVFNIDINLYSSIIIRSFVFGSTYSLHPGRADLEADINARTRVAYDTTSAANIKSYPDFVSRMPIEIKRQLQVRFANHKQTVRRGDIHTTDRYINNNNNKKKWYNIVYLKISDPHTYRTRDVRYIYIYTCRISGEKNTQPLSSVSRNNKRRARALSNRARFGTKVEFLLQNDVLFAAWLDSQKKTSAVLFADLSVELLTRVFKNSLLKDHHHHHIIYTSLYIYILFA